MSVAIILVMITVVDNGSQLLCVGDWSVKRKHSFPVTHCHAWHPVPLQKYTNSLRNRTYNVKEAPYRYDNAAQRQQASGSIENQHAARTACPLHASSVFATVQHDYRALRQHRLYSRDLAETNLIYYDDSHWRQYGPYLWRLPVTIAVPQI